MSILNVYKRISNEISTFYYLKITTFMFIRQQYYLYLNLPLSNFAENNYLI